MKIKNFLGIIPARYQSTRFPGKPLAMIEGKTMLQRVYEQASKALETVIIATDDHRILEHAKTFGALAILTSKNHKTGTDRCNEAYFKLLKKTNTEFDVVINIQGDEPFINPNSIETLKTCFNDPQTDIATLIKKTNDINLLKSPNSAKIIKDKNDFAIYFSRSVIPFVRDENIEKWTDSHQFYKHIGIYAYRTDVLQKITKLEQSSLEKAESLEQNRWLENGFKIKTAETIYETLSVDTPEDLQKLLKMRISKK